MPTLKLPSPPVPAKLREMLKGYPRHIEELQVSLNRLITNPMHGTSPFERAIWLLEGRLGTFISEARDELQAAETSGDAEAIARAKEKELLMLHARGLHGLHDLRAYFQANKESFE